MANNKQEPRDYTRLKSFLVGISGLIIIGIGLYFYLLQMNGHSCVDLKQVLVDKTHFVMLFGGFLVIVSYLNSLAHIMSGTVSLFWRK